MQFFCGNCYQKGSKAGKLIHRKTFDLFLISAKQEKHTIGQIWITGETIIFKWHTIFVGIT